MPDDHDSPHRTKGIAAIEMLEETFIEDAEPPMSTWTTAELADFWHGATEACTLRLVRLKPELVRKVIDGHLS